MTPVSPIRPFARIRRGLALMGLALALAAGLALLPSGQPILQCSIVGSIPEILELVGELGAKEGAFEERFVWSCHALFLARGQSRR